MEFEGGTEIVITDETFVEFLNRQASVRPDGFIVFDASAYPKSSLIRMTRVPEA
jgi:hypothetical protein